VEQAKYQHPQHWKWNP